MSSPPLVFISYSRRDAGIARKITQLGRAFGVTPWRDEEALSPGDDWRLKIAATIEECDRILVLWCRHAQASGEVRREYLLGLALRKLISTVRLDKCALPAELRRFHAQDISGFTWWSHEITRIVLWLLIAGCLLLVIGGVTYVFL